MAVYHFRNFEMLDPDAGELRGGFELIVEGDRIKEVSAKPIKLTKADVIDCGGRTLMPGLIDSHVHVVLSEVVIRNLESVPLTLMTARAAELMRRMLDRGFTSVRDTGGADWGLKEATDKGLLPGPRLFIAGRALGPTGGQMGIADGVAEVRRAVREEMRQGCDQVKIMMSGGVASPYDPLDSLQFSLDEVKAAVEEAHAFGRYVCAHAYTPEAITRAAIAGVRTIEHGNLIDDASAKLMAEKGMFLVANLVTYFEMKKHAAEYGMGLDMLAKNDLVIDGALKSLEICKRHGVPVAYGTDLLGQLQMAQSAEFTLRAEVLSPIEIIRSATTIGAKVVRMEGKLGCLKPDAFADLLVVDGNPLKNLKLFQEQGEHLSAIMKGGRFHKNRLS
jgi:imidazolonepropionase-like amidohydrolase